MITFSEYIQPNSFYIKKMIYGASVNITGLVLMGASLLSIPYFCSHTMNLKLSTNSVSELLINIDNMLIATAAAGGVAIGLDLVNLGQTTFFDAARVLRDNHAQTILPTQLLEDDIEMVNNFIHEEPHNQNDIVINMYP